MKPAGSSQLVRGDLCLSVAAEDLKPGGFALAESAKGEKGWTVWV